MSPTDDLAPYEPRHPALLALGAFLLAALTLCWPMLGGGFLLGDDQYVAGLRLPALRGGDVPADRPHPRVEPLPVRRAAVHRGSARRHLLSDGVAPLGAADRHRDEPRLRRAHRAGWRDDVRVAPGTRGPDGSDRWWAGSPTSSPGSWHRWSGRDTTASSSCRPSRPWHSWRCSGPSGLGRTDGYGLLALVVGLCMLSPHYQMTYYLLVAAGLWTRIPRVLRSGAPAGRPRAALAGVRAGGGPAGDRRRSHPGAAVPPVPAVLPAGGRRAQRRVGVRHRLLHAARGDRHHGSAPVQRRAGALLGPELLQAPHRVPRRRGGGARRARPPAAGSAGTWFVPWAASRSSFCSSRSAGTRRSTGSGTK